VLSDFEAIKKYHIEKNKWDDIGYHFVIEEVNGKVVVREGRKLNEIGAHIKGYNDKYIGVCVVGDYDKEQLPQNKLDALIELIKKIREDQGDLPLVYHNEKTKKKTCPGKIFVDKFRLDKMTREPELDWREQAFKYLNDNDIEVHEKRFNAPITRGECMALIARLHKSLK
jgi:hypothetical protein